jgi:carboxymethylenebutenolidase
MNGALEFPTADGPLPVRVFASEPPVRGAVIFYMDAFGWRPELDGMCQRYAMLGYMVFLPDLYHRLGRVSFVPPAKPTEPLDPAMHAANDATSIAMSLADTQAILLAAARMSELADCQFGVVGYCMGARHALAALATHPEQIKAAACLHGGRMVWDGPTSPHLYIPRIKGAAYFGFASNDSTCPDAHQRIIEQTIASSGVRATAEHFAAEHGWTFPTRYCYDNQAAEIAWRRVTQLFATEVSRDPHT